MKFTLRLRPEQEWYIVALIFTVDVILAAIFLTIWAVMALAIFYVLAWLVVMLL